jgi:hypothetical protein
LFVGVGSEENHRNIIVPSFQIHLVPEDNQQAPVSTRALLAFQQALHERVHLAHLWWSLLVPQRNQHRHTALVPIIRD